MKILVANLGSTSFKYRLFDMEQQRQLARGGVERIGAPESRCFVEISGQRREITTAVPDHAVAVRQCLDQLTDSEQGCLQSAAEVAAIGFKAVHGGRYTGVQRVTADVLAAMEEMNGAAPAHNPPYIAAMRLLSEKLPEIPLVAAFETGFHATIPPAWRTYAVPYQWAEQLQIRRWGFHGASHRYIGTRMQELCGRPEPRVISCHLGGSNSLCAMHNGESRATTMGMSPQTGLPHNNRVGDFDPYAIPMVMQATGMSLGEVLETLGNQSGLLGISGVSGDLRDLEQAAADGNERAQLALDVFIAETKRHIGGMLMALGGVDALVFTGGIGENSVRVRHHVCAGLHDLGIILHEDANTHRYHQGAPTPGQKHGELRINDGSSRCEIWIVPTNEEWIVATQAQALLQG